MLGATGMLGSMVTDVLARDPDLRVTAAVRRPDLAAEGHRRVPEAEWSVFTIDDEATTAARLRDLQPQWVVNAIGVTKPYVHDDRPAEVEQALVVNSLFPHWLATAVREGGGRVLQIATDCVYSGRRGGYVETDAHDPLDVYGKTKSLGEVPLPNLHSLRCSIVGPEAKAYAFLLEWFRRQPPAAHVDGFVNHRWNGVTTLHFARLCHGVIREDLELPRLQHVVPRGDVTKHELLERFAQCLDRRDIEISPRAARSLVDRTLRTSDEATNRRLWSVAGHASPPTIPDMLEDLARFDYRLGGLAR